jgi:hypothetical protein
VRATFTGLAAITRRALGRRGPHQKPSPQNASDADPSDVAWYVQRYLEVFGRPPDLIAPRLFSERVGHRLLFDRDPLLPLYCDKVRCKQWIDARIGAGHTPRTLAVVDHAEGLLAHVLPARWMLKATHGSGWMQRIEPPARPFDAAVLSRAQGWLLRNYRDVNREWAYGEVPPRLMAEELLLSEEQGQCAEICAFCFTGRIPLVRLHRNPRAFLADTSAEAPEDEAAWPLECFTDGKGRILPIKRPRRHHDPSQIEHWSGALAPFLKLARRLSAHSPFLRIDGYRTAAGVCIGEVTPYPYAGLGFDLEVCWDAWLGRFWV